MSSVERDVSGLTNMPPVDMSSATAFTAPFVLPSAIGHSTG